MSKTVVGHKIPGIGYIAVSSMLNRLLTEVSQCRICEAHLPLGPNPVVSIGPQAKILIIGQAPGTRVHESGIPWNDQSGKELRRWLGVTVEQFYDIQNFAIMPMGFCYPGKGSSGDLPPRPECAPQWHSKLLALMPSIQLTLLIGQYAQKYYLGEKSADSITENVRNYQSFLPEFLPLVHPSPRNKIWQKKNPWFEDEVVPFLKKKVRELINPL